MRIIPNQRAGKSSVFNRQVVFDLLRPEISRRSFLRAAAPFALGLGVIARGQLPIERGRFSEDDIPLAREQLLKQVNADRAHVGKTERGAEIGLLLALELQHVEAHRAQGAIQADMNAGNQVGAGGTPTFFINGHRLVGAMPLDSFKQIIDAELASKVAKK